MSAIFTAAPYVAGSVTVPSGVVSNLLVLIRDQVQSNTPGSAAELRLEPGPANGVPIYFGVAGDLAGPLSATNYGFQLAATSPSRVYQSTFPGSPTPLGLLQVFATATALLHVEVTT